VRIGHSIPEGGGKATFWVPVVTLHSLGGLRLREPQGHGVEFEN